MQIKATREVKNSEVSTTLTVEALGSSTLSAEEEREILEDYILTINYAEVIFSRYIAVDDHQNPHIVEAPTVEEGQEPPEIEADLVVLQMPYESHEITEDMALKFAVSTDELEGKLSAYKYITDSACLAKAMIIIYEDVMTAWIKEKVELSRKHRDDFEKEQFYLI